MTEPWQPYCEPLRATLLRTFTIAIILGAALAIWRGSGWAGWPIATLLALWPALGGHFVELWFLNWLRPRLPTARTVQIAARLTTWFLAGIFLALGTNLTAMALHGARPAHWPPWWIVGPAFIAIELIAHVVLQLRCRPSFYNGRG
jgi:hypothetical protein